MNIYQAPRGTRDILPDDQPYWEFLRKIITLQSAIFGFQKIDTPLFEETKIFERGIGRSSDIVEKELFQVSRQKSKNPEDKKIYSLRPEGTAGVVRAYLQNGLANKPKPVKLWYEGQMFRYDRPQKGRLRELRQFGVEVFGDPSPGADAEIVLLGWRIFEELKLTKEISLEVNTIGDIKERENLKKELVKYYSAIKNNLCEDCRQRIKSNPLKLLDCKEEKCQKFKSNAPKILDLLESKSKEHFTSFLELLDELNIPYDLNPFLVRGLDYYSRTTFEFVLKEDLRRQNSLGGGGRYNGLVELLGGKSTPATGFALGMDRIIDVLKDKKIPIPEEKKKKSVAIVQMGEKAQGNAFGIYKKLLKKKIPVIISPGKKTLKSQMRFANANKAGFALIIGQREALDKTAIVKNLENGSQQTVKQEKLLDVLSKKFAKR